MTHEIDDLIIEELESELADLEYGLQVVAESKYRGPATVAGVEAAIAEVTHDCDLLGT